MLRARPLGEADRIVTLFSSESGKLDAVAKGVRRARSHLAGRLEFGNECELQMHRGRSLDIIVHADILAAPWQSLVEPERFTTAQLVAELIDAFCEPELAMPEVYALLSGALSAIASTENPRALVARFSLRLLAALGIEPPLESCVRCSRPFEDGVAFLDSEMGGFSCSKCRERWREGVELDADDLRNLQELGTPKGTRGATVHARPRVAAAIDALVVHHLGRKPKAAV